MTTSYYEYDAIVNGEITTVKATDKNLKIGLYQNVSYDENGYMDDQDLVKDASDDDFKVYTGIKTISYKSGVLSLGSNDVVLADSYKIFVNDDGDGKTTTPAAWLRTSAWTAPTLRTSSCSRMTTTRPLRSMSTRSRTPTRATRVPRTAPLFPAWIR